MTDKEKTPYHKIMVDAWRIFIKERTHEKYSDPWWEEIIAEYESLRKPYKDTDLDDYVCQVSMAFLDEYERKRKRERQSGISTTILSSSQGRNTTEIQCSDNIPQVGGCKEVIEPFT